jgi:RHS repeat-associated protein
VTFLDGSSSKLSGSAKDWVFLHQCGVRIASGDYVFRNRVYSPSLGKWLSNDPLGFNTGDPGWFRAYKNNPISKLDPSGLWSLGGAFGRMVIGGGVGAGVSAPLFGIGA